MDCLPACLPASLPPRYIMLPAGPIACVPAGYRQSCSMPDSAVCTHHASLLQGQAGAKRASYEARWQFFASKHPGKHQPS